MKRFDVWLVNLDPTVGSEIKKTRPGVIVSPDELNAHLQTVVVVPLPTARAYPFRIATQVQGKKGVAASIRFERSISDGLSRKWARSVARRRSGFWMHSPRCSPCRAKKAFAEEPRLAASSGAEVVWP